MDHFRRRGFTLVELLVVIAIIGMLMALLLPAVMSSREAARRLECRNHLRQLALALAHHESSRGHFPGYRNYLGDDVEGNPVLASWLVKVFPEAEQKPVYLMWRDPQVRVADKPVITWELATCPSDVRDPPADPRRPWLAYGANCGAPNAAVRPSGSGRIDGPACGIFHNHDTRPVSAGGVGPDPITVSLDYLNQHDGTTNTLLLSENLAGDSWTDLGEANVGLIWDPFWEPDLGAAGTIPVPPGINFDPEGDHPRPSSRHPGGVNAVFCDVHARFLAEQIDYLVYQHLMTPWSRKAGQIAEMNPSPTLPNLRTSVYDPGGH
jgi:prepilin-type N-terminal cleavage/methylation domain-containing protein/prepilin-type processing-associated H-X9-DG protein